ASPPPRGSTALRGSASVPAASRGIERRRPLPLCSAGNPTGGAPSSTAPSSRDPRRRVMPRFPDSDVSSPSPLPSFHVPPQLGARVRNMGAHRGLRTIQNAGHFLRRQTLHVAQ